MKKLTGESMNITEENLKAMQQLFPEAFEEGKIDFDVLRQLLGDFVDDEQERYSFKWNGKGKALRLSQTPSMGTLRPCKEESKDWDNTENLYIEGDNLEVLKLLQKSYYGKVKMIYIDPPYNTGGDFVYKDNFHDNIQNYKEVTGQIDGEGNKIDTNTESNGRFHTDWLNMMYPRLRLARNLLTDDGVIFISIDDNEQGNLKRLCDEVFGESNFITCITRGTGTPTGGGFDGMVNELDYVIMYAKNIKQTRIYGLPMDEESSKIYDQEDEYGRYLIRPLRRTGGEDRREDRPTMYFPIIAPDGTPVYPIGPTGYESRWICGPQKAKELEENHQIFWKKTNKNGIDIWQVYQKYYLENRTKAPGNLWTNVEGNKKATRDIRGIFEQRKVFDFPKPVGFLKKVIQISTGQNDIVMDFFSGSATSAHAVMQLNAEVGNCRKFIMVQLPEQTEEDSEAYKAEYKNICEIGKERIRRAGDKIKAEAGDKAADLDIGFKVFKLDSSNLQKWNPQPDDLVMTLQQATDNFLPDRTEQDVLYEIMLKMGLDLTCQIEEEQAAGETVYIIGGGALMICLGRNITTAVAEAVVKLHAEYESELWQVVFRDTGFASDMDKTNVKETLKAAGLDEDSFVCV